LAREREINIFETTNLDLGAFLMLEDIQYLGCRVSAEEKSGDPVAILRFLDEKQNCRDLERVFMTSREKHYRDLNKFLLKDIHRAIREFGSKLSKKIED
jgi:hypothetical protein